MKVGILGGGQLAQMLALSGIPLGLEFYFFEQMATRSVEHLGPLTIASFTDSSALARFAAQVDVITFESENIPHDTLECLMQHTSVHPGVKSLVTTQNRLNEKMLCDELHIPTVRYQAVRSVAELQQAASVLGFPFIVKTVSGGYDGKGQYRLCNQEDLQNVPFSQDVMYLAEEWVAFDCEVSCIMVRSQGNQMRHYGLCLNQHEEGILIKTTPLDDADLMRQACDYTQRIMQALDHVGVLTVEFFVRDAQLLVNEMAPRVHNTGHWTIEAAACSQFENHLRAICNLPLGDTTQTMAYTLHNIIGQWPDRYELLRTPRLHLHDYKKEPRARRKLGHVTITQD